MIIVSTMLALIVVTPPVLAIPALTIVSHSDALNVTGVRANPRIAIPDPLIAIRDPVIREIFIFQ